MKNRRSLPMRIIDRFTHSHANATAPVRLNRRRIYVFPTGAGFAFVLVLLFLLIGSINYGKNLGYAITFLLSGLFVNSIFYSFRNLNGLTIDIGRIEPVFCGQAVKVPLHLSSTDNGTRPALEASIENGEPVHASFDGNGSITLNLPHTTDKRGRMEIGFITLKTTYPLSLIQAWTVLKFDISTTVYPEVAEDYDADTIRSFVETESGGNSTTAGDQFDGIKNYQRGDRSSQILWKALAKERGIYSKDFRSYSIPALIVDWYMFGNMPLETRLSSMCALLLDCERLQTDYGMRLPALGVSQGHGPGHLHQCLKLLALYPDIPAEPGPWQRVA